jgi:nitroreductase
MDTVSPSPKAVCDVFDALRTRRSVRAFLPDPVERQVIEAILELAARAPSGSNIQPWKVWVAAGQARQTLCDKLLAAHTDDEPGHVE